MDKEIKLTNRKTCTRVSQEDYARVKGFSWRAKQSGYGWYICTSVRIGKKVHTVRLHRMLTDCPDGMTVDHLNGDTFDNTRGNLEIVTLAENQRRKFGRLRAMCDSDIFDPHAGDEVPF